MCFVLCNFEISDFRHYTIFWEKKKNLNTKSTSLSAIENFLKAKSHELEKLKEWCQRFYDLLKSVEYDFRPEGSITVGTGENVGEVKQVVLRNREITLRKLTEGYRRDMRLKISLKSKKVYSEDCLRNRLKVRESALSSAASKHFVVLIFIRFNCLQFFFLRKVEDYLNERKLDRGGMCSWYRASL